ncbi:MAG: HAMP domain-containing sensor histidine kinase, partial [Acidobacteriota bacterium]
AELALRASIVYGLAWIDGAGRFHDEALRREPDLLDGPYDLWLLSGDRVYLSPEVPTFRIDGLAELAAEVVETEPDDFYVDGQDVRGRPYRLHGLATYAEESVEGDPAIAAIVVVADPGPWRSARLTFVREIVLSTALLTVLGLFVGGWLSRRSLRPVVEALDQQRQFLAAAAHELRTPIAGLRAVHDSARDGDLSPGEALERLSGLTDRADVLVNKLLLLARLDAGTFEIRREKVRLDLLVESALPEDGSVEVEAAPSTVEADADLLASAVRNLVENAGLHGGGAVRVRVEGSTVTVEDDGPGIDDEVRSRATEAFVSRRASPGSGLGLTIVDHVARLHGGRLRLDNRAGGGARARLELGSRLGHTRDEGPKDRS